MNKIIFWVLFSLLIVGIIVNLFLSGRLSLKKISQLFHRQNQSQQTAKEDPYLRPAPKFLWGVGVMTTPTNVGKPELLDQILTDAQNLGVDAIRLDWPDYIKKDDYDYMDRVINAALDKNLKILLVVAQEQNLFDKTDQYQIGHDDAVLLAKHYKGRINYYQVGNEPAGNIINPDWPGITEDSYYPDRYQKELNWLKGFSDGLNSIDSNAKRIINGHWLHTGFFDMVIRDGLKFEIIGWDWDQKGNSDLTNVENNGQSYNLLEKLTSFKKELWLTEVNAFKGSLKGEDYQAAYIKDMAQKVMDYKVFSGFFVFRLNDESHKQDSDEKDLGLIGIKKVGNGWEIGEKKKAYYTYQDIIKQYRGK